MKSYFEPALSAEQLAAYLDGMASTEESNMLESMIADDPVLQEITDSIDAVDSSYITYDDSQEIPLECLSDDFELPSLDGSFMASSADGLDSSMAGDYGDDATYADLPDDDYVSDGLDTLDSEENLYDDSYDVLNF